MEIKVEWNFLPFTFTVDKHLPSPSEKVDRLLFCKKEYYNIILKYNVVVFRKNRRESMMSYHEIGRYEFSDGRVARLVLREQAGRKINTPNHRIIIKSTVLFF
jgi:hypothetical protein